MLRTQLIWVLTPMVDLENGAEVVDGRWIMLKTGIFIGRYKPLKFVRARRVVPEQVVFRENVTGDYAATRTTTFSDGGLDDKFLLFAEGRILRAGTPFIAGGLLFGWFPPKPPSTRRATLTILDPHSPPAFFGLSHIVSPALTQATRAIIEEFLFWPLNGSEE